MKLMSVLLMSSSCFVITTLSVNASEIDKISGLGNQLAYWTARYKNLEARCADLNKSISEGDLVGQCMRISHHYDAEETRITDHFIKKGIHDDENYSHLYKSLVAAPVAGGLLMGAWHCYDKCKNFNPTAQELRNKWQEKQSQYKKTYQHGYVEASRIAQKSPAGLATVAGSTQLANEVIASRVADLLAGDQKKEIPVNKNDIRRYRRYRNAGIFCGATGCLAGAFSLYQFGKFINYPEYPSFVPHEFVPNKPL